MKFPIKLPQKLTRLAGRALLKGRQVSPEVCVVVGIIGCGAAVVMAVKKTWTEKEKLSKASEEVKEQNDIVQTAKKEKPDDTELIKTEKKALVKANVNLVKTAVKTYWIPTVLFISSAGMIWGGRTILRKELSAMTAAYATLMDIHKRYRQRVVEEFGAEKDQEFEYGVKMVDAIDSDTGEVVKKAIVDRKNSLSQYARWFDEGIFNPQTGQWLVRNYAWRDDPLLNYATVLDAQNTANNLLKAKGYLFLNEVYKILGLPPTVDGQIVGWDMCGNGDRMIDFGVFEGPHQLEVNKLFCAGKTRNCLLDFNVDGPILGALEKTWGPEQTQKLIEHCW